MILSKEILFNPTLKIHSFILYTQFFTSSFITQQQIMFEVEEVLRVVCFTSYAADIVKKSFPNVLESLHLRKSEIS